MAVYALSTSIEIYRLNKQRKIHGAAPVLVRSLCNTFRPGQYQTQPGTFHILFVHFIARSIAGDYKMTVNEHLLR